MSGIDMLAVDGYRKLVFTGLLQAGHSCRVLRAQPAAPPPAQAQAQAQAQETQAQATQDGRVPVPGRISGGWYLLAMIAAQMAGVT